MKMGQFGQKSQQDLSSPQTQNVIATTDFKWEKEK
jgi:hypothetical protein